MTRVRTAFPFAWIYKVFLNMFWPLTRWELWLGFVFIRNKSVNGEIVKEATDVFSLESNLHPLA